MPDKTVTLNFSAAVDCLHGCLLKIDGEELSLVPSRQNDNVFWMMNCAFLVVSMQLGFAMLEVGSVRKAHRTTVLAKNVLDATVSMIGFWAFCKWRNSSLVSDSNGDMQSYLILFHASFCGAAVTICSGAMAERAHMNAYMLFSIIMSLLIYPELAEGAWTDDATLSSQFQYMYKYHDFAGSGVVHLTGGCGALIGNIFLGRRIMNKHDGTNSGTATPDAPHNDADARRLSSVLEELEAQREGGQVQLPTSPRTPTSPKFGDTAQQEQVETAQSKAWLRRYDDADRDKHEFGSSSSYLQVMGMFTLWVGWYGFNTGAALSVLGDGSTLAGNIAMNTTLAACAGGFGSYLHCYGMMQRIDLSIICNGVISGLIAITAPCDICTRIDSAIIGFLAGLILYPVFHHVARLLKLDDPVDAIPVHAGSGLFGVLAVPFCTPDCTDVDGDLLRFGSLAHFCAKDYQLGRQLVAQTWGALTIIAYTCCISVLVWGLPAVCECALALEDELLEKVAAILLTKALNSSGEEQQPDNELIEAAQQSEVALNILKQYGWVNNGFEKPEYGDPMHLLQICRHIKAEQNTKFKTALEILHWRTCSFFANILRHCHLHTYCTLRLRVLPASELSGLGTTDIDGGWIPALVQKLIKKEAASSSRGSNEKLQKEVRQLHALVHGQQALLRSLAKHSQPRMPSIPDAENEKGEGSHASPTSSPSPSSLERLLEKSVETSLLRGGSTTSSGGASPNLSLTPSPSRQQLATAKARVSSHAANISNQQIAGETMAPGMLGKARQQPTILL